MRQTLSFFLAVVISGSLFLLMNLMISGGHWNVSDTRSYSIVDFVRIKPDEQVDTRKRTLPKKSKLPEKDLPKPVYKQSVTPNRIDMPKLDMDAPNIEGFKLESSLFLGGYSNSSAGAMPDGDVIPLIRIAPSYPRNAAVKGIEGWVKLKFTIEEDGTVSSPEVIDAKPSRVFDHAALIAIKKWKFKPKLVDGKPMSRKAEQVIEFKLQK
jgi:protein TonB